MPTASQRTSLRSIRGTIPGGATNDFDCVPFSTYRGNKYLVKLYSEAEDRHNYYEITGMKKNADVTDQITSRSVSNLNVSLNIAKILTEVCLRIVNNESFAVDVSIVKID